MTTEMTYVLTFQASLERAAWRIRRIGPELLKSQRGLVVGSTYILEKDHSFKGCPGCFNVTSVLRKGNRPYGFSTTSQELSTYNSKAIFAHSCPITQSQARKIKRKGLNNDKLHCYPERGMKDSNTLCFSWNFYYQTLSIYFLFFN